MEQIEKAKEKGDYQEAGRIADGIEWERVKRVAVLCDIAEIYDRIGNYDKCKDILLLAYERSPIGRMIVYRLCDISVKLRQMDEAKEYYSIYSELAPNDAHRYILLYKIEKASGASIDRLISILENLKSREFLENWAYELAYLYHKKGMPAQCVDECNEIFLWFGDGRYVEKALELKMLYEPLTQIQRDKYEYSRAKRIAEAKKANRKLAEFEPKVPSEDEADIPSVEVSVGFNTINLQKELAKNLEQIMNATLTSDVTQTMANVKKLVSDSQIPGLHIEEPEEAEEEAEEASEIPEASLDIDFRNFLSEEYDGQISLIVPENNMVEKQITGQMSIEDVLAEWEKTKRAAEHALELDEARRLEQARNSAIKQTEGIMTRLADVIPQYEEVGAQRIAEERIKAEAAAEAALLAESISSIVPELTEDNSLGTLEGLFNEPEVEVQETTEEVVPVIEHMDSVDEKDEEAVLVEETSWTQAFTEEVEEAVASFDRNLEEAAKLKETKYVEAEQEKITEPIEESKPAIKISEYILSAGQVAELSYFAQVKGIEKQVCQFMKDAKNASEEGKSFGNIIISGAKGMGKTKFAMSLVKVMQQAGIKKNGKFGKVSADKLNSKDIVEIFQKIEGGCIVIEQISELSSEKADELLKAIQMDTTGITVILEDTTSALGKFLNANFDLATKFTNHISIPTFSNDELVNFGKAYAEEQGYMIDEMAVLALYNRIGQLQFARHETTLSEVMDLIDDAIDNASVTGLAKLFSKRKDKILLEKDFE